MPPFLLVLLAILGSPPPVDAVVVCPPELQPSLAPWIAHREQQGHRLRILSNDAHPDLLRAQIREMAQDGGLRYVVLVGDTAPLGESVPWNPSVCVPVYYAEARVNVEFGSEPTIATDHPYADLDDDGVPDLALGRLTADSPRELATMVDKILAYERSVDFGPWRRRLSVVAGVGGFGALTDALLESATRQLLTRGIPAGFRTSVTYGSWRSPFCPDPRLFHETTVDLLNSGSWFWVYIGHGFHLGLDRIEVPGASYPIFGAGDVDKLECRHSAPIALFLACYTGAFDAAPDCLAERMLRQPGGPVAVLAGSRVTMPYSMAVLGDAMMRQCFDEQCPTLGEALLRAKQSLVRPSPDQERNRAMLDLLAGALSPTRQHLAEERQEHVLLYHLLGDPMLRLRHPKPVAIEVSHPTTPGETLQIRGVSDIDGPGLVELAVPRGKLTFAPPSRRELAEGGSELERFQETYRLANDDRLASVDVEVRDGTFSTTLQVPAEYRGPCHVRVYVQGSEDFALGSADVVIEPREPRVSLRP